MREFSLSITDKDSVLVTSYSIAVLDDKTESIDSMEDSDFDYIYMESELNVKDPFAVDLESNIKRDLNIYYSNT